MKVFILATFIFVLQAINSAGFAKTYTFGGIVGASQTKESIAHAVIGLWGHLTVNSDGSVSGSGIVRYEGVAPCQWTPPAPDQGSPPYCKLDNLFDGQFEVVGQTVLDQQIEYRLQKLAQMVGGEQITVSEIEAEAPLTLELTLSLTEQPRELISLWGFSNGNTVQRETNVGAAGLLISGLFEKPFLLSPLKDNEVNLTRFESSGEYEGDWPIIGAGAVYFLDLPIDKLPTETSVAVFQASDAESYPDRDELETPRDLAERVDEVMDLLVTDFNQSKRY